MMKLSVKALGLATGITWALCNLIAGWTAMIGWGNPYVDLMSSIYFGYDATIVGSLIGAAWAFVDGFLGGAVVAFIYNKVAKTAS